LNPTAEAENAGALLAVDLGLKTGLALYTGDGRLRSYRSHNFGSVPRMRKEVYRILTHVPELGWHRDLPAELRRGS
jgi:hypothetical protein